MTVVELGGAMMLHSVGLCQVIMEVFALKLQTRR